uniref:HDA1 complex subunit 3,HDA1 complex subunit 3 n=1 Tax=Saccharomyces cerevisiae (strain ATCC 204508 / S288c) TaxID=559292 RepID=UPI00194ADA63|nr:Chain D, HDA1 complex subunit 3,HDA1 complex subunit 3 [Saccharomyces cerevisiae S288C]6Z6H_D Chain D, HDA1 complex subunit 3,HDA1 complex subunit 3 [Saccharomyces cerevisiae S288C]6Z6H_J Chain J, HDA1 complex subunit 3,HDA1 complex subunit 3 [Saccharomyces cerevisiae S288C]6Z6P_M Chain M, HDA1 complex subunit 3,HDA1 complex subunit 3 [Saccharomyces cerevisiae S288C]
SGDYWLPTTMSLYQKELTDQIVSLHYSDILRYFETSHYKEDVILESMKTMCLNGSLVATHPYLLIDHYMPKSLITRDVPAHLAENSGKFSVLRDLINLVQEYETETAIVCRPGRTMDLLEALLLGNKVHIKRYDGHSIKSKQKANDFSCTVHLFSSEGINFTKYPIKSKARFDMLICLDTTVDTSQKDIQYLLQYKRERKGLERYAPIVRLVAINSIDHCRLFFGKKFDKNSREYLENVTAAMVILRDRLGTLPPDLRPIYSQKLHYLVEWLENPTVPWPLPDIYPLKQYTSMDVERSLLTEVHFKKNSSNVNYHLSSGIITHKLIQSMGEVYMDICVQKQELDDYSCLDDLQNDHLKFFSNEDEKIIKEYETVLRTNNENLNRSHELEVENNLKFSQIETLEKDIETLKGSLMAQGETLSKLKDAFVKTDNVQDEIEKEERVSVSRDTEKKYMEQEIKRAVDAIRENEEETHKLNEKQNGLESELKLKFEKSEISTKELNEKIGFLKKELKLENDLNEELVGQLSKTMDNLENLTIPRVRTQ